METWGKEKRSSFLFDNASFFLEVESIEGETMFKRVMSISKRSGFFVHVNTHIWYVHEYTSV